jgi:threonine dehydratase
MSARQRLKGVAIATPLLKNQYYSSQYGCNLFLKREDMQVVRSFKIRGAYNKMKLLSKEELAKGIVCASAGNHAQGVAMACEKLNVKGTIFMPSTTPNQKINKVKQFGGAFVEVILIGDTYDESSIKAKELSEQKNLPFIHAFNDRDIIAGQGTVGVEILEMMEEPVDYLIVSVGGGGLISGIGSYFNAISPETKIIAVEAEGAPSLKTAMDAGEVKVLSDIDGFADGIATQSVGDITLAICQEIVDQVILVPEGKMCTKILELYNEEAIVVEPACASVIAALDDISNEIKGKNVVVVLSGGNNDITRMEEIKERSLLYEGTKHYFLIKFPQRAGALKEFLNILGEEDDISHFEYTKKNSRQSGPALVGIEIQHKDDFDSLVKRMADANIDFQHLNNNPMLFEMLI